MVVLGDLVNGLQTFLVKAELTLYYLAPIYFVYYSTATAVETDVGWRNRLEGPHMILSQNAWAAIY
eukprot:11009293-Karenia_brevis.AAC.1